ncbi:MAG: hypothetical protein D6744_10195 [Planctomycetota bacterium]|nr:MAG: hypothetical protein D6744_10195 [Planctomycetota bacterium]
MSARRSQSDDSLLRERLFEPLRRLRRRARLYIALSGAARMLVAIILASLAQLLLDRWLRLSIDQRVFFNIVITLIWTWGLIRWVVRPLSRELSDDWLAAQVDQAHPELRDLLATAVQFAEGRVGSESSNSPALMRRAVREACAAAEGVSFLAGLNHRRARRFALQSAGMLALVALGFAVPHTRTLLSTWFQRNWLVRETSWPQATTIVPVGFDEYGQRRFPIGDELRIEAMNRGRVPRAATLRWRTSSGRSGREAMTLVGDARWEASLGVLEDSITFRIVGGDERTREYTVIGVERPRVVGMLTTIEPPAYTGLQPLQLQDQSVLDVPHSSRIRIRARLNKPVASARVVGTGGPVGRVVVDESAEADFEWDSPQAGAYRFELTDRWGLANRRPVRLTIKVRADAPPAVALTLDGIGESVTPRAELPVEVHVTDEYGVAQVSVMMQRNEDPPAATPLTPAPEPSRDLERRLVLTPRDLDITPGDRLRIWCEARDNNPAGEGVARTEPVDLRVLSASDLLAELAQRELELRQRFEQLLSAQRGLADALRQVMPEASAGRATAALAQQLGGLARRQSEHASQVGELRAAFESILEQMRNNKVLRVADERRIGQRIAQPLGRLEREEMPAAAATIGALRVAVANTGSDPLVQQADILDQMQTILSSMLEWEGFNAAVALLAEIVEQQEQLHEDTVDAVESELDAILDFDADAAP